MDESPILNRHAHNWYTALGHNLPRRRADLHLAHGDVAGKTASRTSQIQALEQDDYSSLRGNLCARYLKKLCLLLGLSPEPILEAHTRLTTGPVTPDFKAIGSAEGNHQSPSSGALRYLFYGSDRDWAGDCLVAGA